MTARQSFIRAVTPTFALPGVFGRFDAQDAAYERVKTEEDYQLGPIDGKTAPVRRQHTLFGAFQQLFAQCSRRLTFAVIGLLGLLILVTELVPSSQHRGLAILGQADHKLYLLIPASNEVDLDFCRAEMTAAVLGYPTPFILNREDGGRSGADQERGKIRMTNDHLNGMEESRDNDLVIVLDSAHNWFQLRPEVLISRYYNIVERANARTAAQAGKEGAPTQSIVFAAQNHCSGATLDELPCFAAPTSPTDKASTVHFLNAGLAIGPVKDMRKLWNRVNGKSVSRQGDDITQQTLLAEIYGQQEFRREYLRQGSWSSSKRKIDSVLKAVGYTKSASIIDSVPGRKLLENPENTEYEMGITLDYRNELGLSISHDADTESVDWIRHDPKYRASNTPLPHDILYSMPPFWTMTSSSLPLGKTWADVPLLTSKRTGEIPAIINLNDHDGPSKKGGLDWRTLWLHAYAQELYEKQMEVSRLPLMSVVDGDGTQHTFWNQELRMDRDGANWAAGGWKQWSEHCGWGEAGEVVLLGKE